MSTPISEDFTNIFKNFKKLCEKHFDLTKFSKIFVKSFHSSSKVFRYFLEIFYRIVLYCIVLYCVLSCCNIVKY